MTTKKVKYTVTHGPSMLPTKKNAIGYPFGKHLAVRPYTEAAMLDSWWQIDHIPTGYRLGTFKTQKRAFRMARMIRDTVSEEILALTLPDTMRASFPKDVLDKLISEQDA